MYDFISDLFSQAGALYQANSKAKILVDFNAALTPTNTLTGPANAWANGFFGTLAYTPGGEGHAKIGNDPIIYFYPAAFSYPGGGQYYVPGGSLTPPLQITGWHPGLNFLPAIYFNNAPLVPTTPPLASPTSINVDGTTNIIYGVAGSLFVTIALFNLRG